MELIRTDRAAMISCAVMIGLFVLIGVRAGIGVSAHAGGSLDGAVMLALLAAVIYGSLFYVGHELLQSRAGTAAMPMPASARSPHSRPIARPPACPSSAPRSTADG